MKTIYKEIKLDNLEMSINNDCASHFSDETREVKYTFRLPYFIYPKNQNVKIVYEDEEAESLKEFMKNNQINKADLVKWLNKNYK